MARIGLVLFACVALLASASAHAQTLLGHLELQWGDPSPELHARYKAGHDANGAPRFNVSLLTDRGVRVALDPAQARRAAGDLHALSGRRVAIALSQAKSQSGLQGVEVIVPADDIGQQPEHLVAGKADAVHKSVTGSRRWMTVACKFSDVQTEQKTIAFFQGQYGEAPGQLGHYWREVSHQKTNLQGSDAVGWFTLPHPRSHYVDESGDKPKADLTKLFNDCTGAANPTVDFSTVLGINLMFNGDLDGFAWGGSRSAMLDGPRRNFPTTWNPPWSFNNLAVLAHEMGHGYGLPHSDNSDGDDDPYDNPWDVMSDSWRNAVSDPTYGTRPKHINIVQRDRLGWVDAPRKRTVMPTDEAVTVALDFAHLPASGNTQMLVLAMPQAPDPYRTTLYTLEARQRAGTYEGALAGTAVIIHRLRQDYSGLAYSQDADVPPADRSNNEGSMFKPGESWVTPEGMFLVRVVSQTATGFMVQIDKPRLTGGNNPARQR
ncbi:hypothetical protein E2F46_13385 [Luteimonas aestuarii]|uniref:M6 family metalloprotease domain-containing protein n=1 Tax=Luteimonas aestuarii TaxID=453837 RepID=A0A4R5TK98_9GAMM|nr:hypothetical protein [Luteimonas aestuarii]TDK22744.1 hypothetical protein E2F46_13385 [Luteimonas aestuarii]